MKNHRALVWFLAVSVLAMMFALWVAREPPRPAGQVTIASASGSIAGGPSATQWQPTIPSNVAAAPQVAPVLLDDLSKTFGSAAAMQKVKENYLLANRYPPGMIRMTKEMRGLLEPNRPEPSIVSLGDTPANKPEEAVSAVFETDLARAIGSEAISLRLAVWKGATKLVAEPVKILKATVEQIDPKLGKREIGKFTLAPQPGAAERAQQLGGMFTPPVDVLAGYNGVLVFSVLWQINGHEQQASVLTVEYTDVAPAKFTGVVRDEVKDGSLDVHVGVDVTIAGRYAIEGRLFAADGTTPVGFTVAQLELAEGPNDVKLTFYGLVFHDAKTPGPYVINTLTGNAFDKSSAGARGRQMKPWTTPYTTKPYPLESFTTKEHDSPMKQNAIKALDEQISAAQQK